ncbi:MAG: DsrE family protein [Acidithiobacillus sp.]
MLAFLGIGVPMTAPMARAASPYPVAVPAEPTQAQYGVVFQLDSGGDAAIKKTLANIENLLKDPRLKGKVTVELVANSKGYQVYDKNNGFGERLLKLKEHGVILAQCANTLRELHVDRKALYPFITIVPAGVGEITLRQAQGWAYIHPTPPSLME